MNNKTIELTFIETCELGEVLEFVLEGLDECDDRVVTLKNILDKVDSQLTGTIGSFVSLYLPYN